MENPWDGGDGGILRHLIYTACLCFLASLAFMGLTGNISAQAVLPPPVEEVDLPSTPLSPAEIALAEDYCGLLDRLEKNCTDYLKYFSVFDNLYAQKSQKQLLRLLVNIKSDAYCIDVEALMDDLGDLIDELDSYEDNINPQDDKKLYRLIKKLRFEMQLIDELLEEDVAQTIEEEPISSLPALKQYIKNERSDNKFRFSKEKSIANLANNIRVKLEKQQDLAQDFKIQLSEEQLKQIQEAVKLSEQLVTVITLELEQSDMTHAPDVVHVPDVPDVPSPERAVEFEKRLKEVEKTKEAYAEKMEKQAYTYSYTIGKTGVSKEFVDSLHVISSHTPIYIKNKSGDVEINGWDKNLVKVVFEIEVLAESNAMANQLIDGVSLQLSSSNNEIILSPVIPSLSDPRRKILKSQMVVVVPSNNKVICENAFGETIIKNIKKSVTLTSNNSNVYLKNLRGGIQTIITNGSANVTDCSDSINMVTKLGQVVMKDCRGYFSINNSYAPLELIDCTGPATISNNSEVTITDHTGNVNISNSNAQIQINGLRGNLTASTSFKPMYISEINGSVTAQNNNSLINVNDITGQCNATNLSGQIIAHELKGPIAITNNNGSISLVISPSFTGPSSINSNYGTVNLTVNKKSDLLLSNLVEGGVVKSNTNLPKNTSSKSKTFAFGKGSEQLEINGVSTTIIINQTE